MPGRRYYCYYCDVSFPYSREARKRHNGGHTHARLETQHYQQYQNARERYNTEIKREKCRKFLSGKGCNFGEECIYSHTTPQELQELRLKCEQETILEEYGPLPSQVTSALSSQSATNVLALDDVAVTKIIIAQRRQQLLSLYPALLLPNNKTASNTDNNTQQDLAVVTPQFCNRGIDCGFGTAPSTTKQLSNWSSYTDSNVNIPLSRSTEDLLPSKLREDKSDSTLSLLSRTDVSSLLPPSMRHYSLDTMLSKPLPEWG